MNLIQKLFMAGKIFLLLVHVRWLGKSDLVSLFEAIERSTLQKKEQYIFKALKCISVVKESAGHFVNYIGYKFCCKLCANMTSR